MVLLMGFGNISHSDVVNIKPALCSNFKSVTDISVKAQVDKQIMHEIIVRYIHVISAEKLYLRLYSKTTY